MLTNNGASIFYAPIKGMYFFKGLEIMGIILNFAPPLYKTVTKISGFCGKVNDHSVL